MGIHEVKFRGLRPPKHKQNRARPNQTPITIIIPTTTKNKNERNTENESHSSVNKTN